MICTIENILTMILTVELIVGTLGNGFIALVNFIDWVKRRKISAVDQILTALAVSRIALIFSFFLGVSLSTWASSLVITRKMMKTIYSYWTVSNHLSMWLATCLSLFYFLKITNFSNSLVAYLRWRAMKVVSVTFLLSLVLLFINTCLLNSLIDGWMSRYKESLPYSFIMNITVGYYRHILMLNNIFVSIPFFMTQSIFLLLIFSLWNHLKNMQHNAQGCRDAKTMAHIRALQSIVASVLLCSMFFLASITPLWKSEILESNLYIRIFQIAGAAFPLGHSCVLILGNTKLRQASLCVLWWLKCSYRQGSKSEGF